jgi:4-amino-4-deoxy-L-arabinose transferase-like glycosyltransferase
VSSNPTDTYSDGSLAWLTDHGRDIALAHFDHLESQASLCATSAGLVVTADSLILAAFVQIAATYHIFTVQWSWLAIPYAIAGVLVVVGMVVALLAIVPNVKGKRYTESPDVLFFGWIGEPRHGSTLEGDKENFKEYAQRFVQVDRGSSSRANLDKALLYQNYRKSAWIRRAFARLFMAISYTIAGTTMATSVVLALTLPLGYQPVIALLVLAAIPFALLKFLKRWSKEPPTSSEVEVSVPAPPPGPAAASSGS